jgi:hypothetical protein
MKTVFLDFQHLFFFSIEKKKQLKNSCLLKQFTIFEYLKKWVVKVLHIAILVHL